MKTEYTDKELETVAKHTYQRLVQNMRDVDIPVVETGYHKGYDGDESGGYTFFRANIFIPDFESHARAVGLAKMPEYDIHIENVKGVSTKKTNRPYAVRQDVNMPFQSSDVMTYDSAVAEMKKANPESVMTEMNVSGTHQSLPISFNILLTGRDYEISDRCRGENPLYRTPSRFETFVKKKFGWSD